MGAKRGLESNAVALAEVCKANDERTFARMRGNDVDAPKPDLARSLSLSRSTAKHQQTLGRLFAVAHSVRLPVLRKIARGPGVF